MADNLRSLEETIEHIEQMLEELEQDTFHNEVDPEYPDCDEETLKILDSLNLEMTQKIRMGYQCLKCFGTRSLGKNSMMFYGIDRFSGNKQFQIAFRRMNRQRDGRWRWSKPKMFMDLEELEFILHNKLIQQALPYLKAERAHRIKMAQEHRDAAT